MTKSELIFTENQAKVIEESYTLTIYFDDYGDMTKQTIKFANIDTCKHYTIFVIIYQQCFVRSQDMFHYEYMELIKTELNKYQLSDNVESILLKFQYFVNDLNIIHLNINSYEVCKTYESKIIYTVDIDSSN